MSVRTVRAHLVVALSAVILTLSACVEPEPHALRFDEAVWRPGETSVYIATDLNGEPAGSVKIVMQPLGDDGWRLQRSTQTQGDEEELIVDMDEQGFRPRASTLVRLSADGREQVEASYDQGKVHLELTTKADSTTTEVVSIPSDSRDARALFVLARSLPLETGYSTKVNTFLPVASRMTRTTLTVLGDETIETPAGAYDTWLLVLDEGDRQSRAWVAKEAPHQLVRYIDGANGGLFELLEFDAAE